MKTDVEKIELFILKNKDSDNITNKMIVEKISTLDKVLSTKKEELLSTSNEIKRLTEKLNNTNIDIDIVANQLQGILNLVLDLHDEGEK